MLRKRKARERGKKSVKARGFQNIDILILLATIIEAMNPITEPMVYEIATPVIPNIGTSAK